ncbi:rhomboid family intramembrane serine protease [Nakamurella silvestris]|nr:rhomboid family intramembrane serine protease [Nakamurella silvestris]
MTMPAPLPSSEPAKKKSGLIPQKWKSAIIVPGVFLGIMVILQIIATFGSSAKVVAWGGIHPRQVNSLLDILTAPFIHGSWGHLLANAVPFLIFGFLLMVNGAKQFIAVTVVVWLVSGIGVWLLAGSNSVTVGASGIVFGWLAYLVVHGVFLRDFGKIALGVVLLLIWGGMFWGVLPKDPNISWQAHLFGAIGGVLAAWLVAKADGPRQPKQSKELPAY